ncbi:nitroreductase family protein [Microbacterium sp. YY-01]|uniref:nitroreductase family protein n=1 Tax=Microbacterium sp. YY-01 TaxID=3421634 RepID=UPI003D180BEE
MSAPALATTSPVEHPVLDVLARRWSPRAFDDTAVIDEQKLSNALEAARWAPSAANSQPWRFVVARRGSALHDQIHASLLGANQLWADRAAVLIVAVAETTKEDGNPYTHAVYDLGQAVAHLSVQAHHDGLVVHQMSGFDPETMTSIVGLDERFTPMTVVALGELGDASTLPEVLQAREIAPRSRRPINETVIVNH